MTFMFLALAQLTNKAFTDAGKGRIRQSLTALVINSLGNSRNLLHYQRPEELYYTEETGK